MSSILILNLIELSKAIVKFYGKTMLRMNILPSQSNIYLRSYKTKTTQ